MKHDQNHVFPKGFNMQKQLYHNDPEPLYLYAQII